MAKTPPKDIMISPQKLISGGASGHQQEVITEDTFMVGSLKGIGRIYLQTVIDCHSRHAWSRLYTNKLPVTAVQVMNNDVLPFFEEHGVKVENMLADNGREYCGRPDHHPFELFLQLEEIEHRTTKVSRSTKQWICRAASPDVIG